MRQSRLRNVELLGGASEVAVPCDGLGVSELAQLDGSFIVNHDQSCDNNILHRSLLATTIRSMPSLPGSAPAPDRHRAAAWRSEITLRLATAADAPALERLAQLESRRSGDGPHLVAARDGVVEAALCLESGELIADPFKRTAELRCLLRCHAGPSPHATPEVAVPHPGLRTALAHA
jgi:hypothetical protein